MKTSLNLCNKLLGSTTQDKGTSFGLSTSLEDIESVTTNLLLLKGPARSKMVCFDVIDRSLDNTTYSLYSSDQILISNSSGTEDISVGEILRSQITDWELGQYNLCPGRNNLFQLIINDLPFSIHDRLVFLTRLNTKVRTETSSILTSALSFSALSSSSTLRDKMMGFLKLFGCCSNPA